MCPSSPAGMARGQWGFRSLTFANPPMQTLTAEIEAQIAQGQERQPSQEHCVGHPENAMALPNFKA